MKNILYKGQLSSQAFEAFSQAWENDDLILFLPPTLNSYAFVDFLPPGEIQLIGELWEESPKIPDHKHGLSFKQRPVAGVFSSGTTKEPKLILYSKENISTSVNGIYSLFDDNAFDAIFCYPQPYHTFGLTLGFGGALIRNKELIFQPGQYSHTHHEKWNECSGRILTLGTPTHFKDLVAWSGQKNPRSSYSCIIGGARVDRNLWLDLQKIANINSPSIGYGATEASPGVSHLPPGQKPLEDGEVGYPLEHVEMTNQASGLKFSGANLCMAIVENGAVSEPQSLILPDLIETREDGVLIYRTRLNWFLNRGGEKFSLERIEQGLFDHLKIDALGFCVEDSRLGEDLGLLVKRSLIDEVVCKERVIEFLRVETGRRFDLEKIISVDELPLNASQKYDRIRAKELYQNKVSSLANQSQGLSPDLYQDQLNHHHHQ